MFLNSLYKIVNKTSSPGGFLITVRLMEDHQIYRAHFPGNPITPGACLVEMARELVSVVLEKEFMLEKADNIKFLRGIYPGKTPLVVFRMQIDQLEEKKWKIRTEVLDGDNIMTKMTLCLQETISV
jgi:3-hydroxyacyl-[acyl-carrier-protein] dehydratase